MAKFRMVCPKCGSHNLDLERDYRGSSARGPHQVQLHCFTCGKVIYGEKAVQAEFDRQREEWEATSRTPALVERSRPKPVPLVRPVVDAAPAAPAKSAPEQAPAPESKATPVAPADGSTPEWWSWPHNEITVDHAPQPPGWEKCAWESCRKGRRPRSKYCSRNCSNKNARARHAKRTKD
ncbi:MAG: hypothetical protein VX899_19390 [Myxococcota bacterium]|nr:hypothetical protein [Myxococcota bacterium]